MGKDSTEVSILYVYQSMARNSSPAQPVFLLSNLIFNKVENERQGWYFHHASKSICDSMENKLNRSLF